MLQTYLGGEDDGAGDLEHSVRPRGLRPVGADQRDHVGRPQQRDQDQQRLGYTVYVTR